MFKKILLGLAIVTGSAVAQANVTHQHPQAKVAGKEIIKQMVGDECLIEVVNATRHRIRVYGTYADGVPMMPFDIYPYDYPHYVDLYYLGYCHPMMRLYIDDHYGYRIYGGMTMTGSSIYVSDAWFSQHPKASLSEHRQ